MQPRLPDATSPTRCNLAYPVQSRLPGATSPTQYNLIYPVGIPEKKYYIALWLPYIKEKVNPEVKVAPQIAKYPTPGERLINVWQSLPYPCREIYNFSPAGKARIINTVKGAALTSIDPRKDRLRIYFIQIVGSLGYILVRYIATIRYYSETSTIQDSEIIRACVPERLMCANVACKNYSIHQAYIVNDDDVSWEKIVANKAEARPLPISEAEARPLPISEAEARPLPISEAEARPLPISEAEASKSDTKAEARPAPISEAEAPESDTKWKRNIKTV